jgi:hypothetical protein
MSLRPARLGSSVKRLKLGSLEVSADVEPQREATAAEANTATEDFPRAQSGSAGWRWDKQSHPVLVETLVCLLAIGLLAYAAVDPHTISLTRFTAREASSTPSYYWR